MNLRCFYVRKPSEISKCVQILCAIGPFNVWMIFLTSEVSRDHLIQFCVWMKQKKVSTVNQMKLQKNETWWKHDVTQVKSRVTPDCRRSSQARFCTATELQRVQTINVETQLHRQLCRASRLCVPPLMCVWGCACVCVCVQPDSLPHDGGPSECQLYSLPQLPLTDGMNSIVLIKGNK